MQVPFYGTPTAHRVGGTQWPWVCLASWGVYSLSKAGLDSSSITFSVFENKHSAAETFLSDVIRTGG